MLALVKTLMSLRGVNQSELARQTGVSVGAISRFLSGSSDLRSDSMFKILATLGTNVDSMVKREINKTIGHEDEYSIGEDIRFLLEQASPIARKMIADTLITSLKNNKSLDTKQRILRLKKYRDSIKTVRRQSC